MGKKSMPSPAAASVRSEQDYRAESDHRTLMDAADIQSDASRMTGVRKQHRKQTKKLSLVQRQMLSHR